MIVLQISQLWEIWVSSIIHASLLFLQKNYFSAPNHERQMFLFLSCLHAFPFVLFFLFWSRAMNISVQPYLTQNPIAVSSKFDL